MKQGIRIICLLAGLAVARPVVSQTIINAERLKNYHDSTVFSVFMAYNGTRGNVLTDRLDLEPSLLLVRPKHNVKLFGGYSLLSRSGDRILNSGFLHLRHNYKIDHRLKSFAFYQIQYNEILLLNRRTVAGSGLRFSFLRSDSTMFDLGAGIMREHEFLDASTLLPGETAVTRYWRLSMVSSFLRIVNDQLKFNNVLYFQPYLGDPGDFRLLNELSASYRLTEKISVVVQNTIRYDSRPPSPLVKTDIRLNVGLSLEI